MPSRKLHYDSSSSDSSYHTSYASRRRLPSPPPSGILRNTNRHVTIIDPAMMTRRVDRITDNLEDANRNLQSVDSKISSFKDVHDDSMSALTKLQEDLEGSIHRLRNTREKRSFTRDTGSMRRSELNRRSASTTRFGSRDASLNREYDSDTTARRRPSSSLGVGSRKFGDGDFSSTARDRLLDLSASQNRMEQDLNDEISRRLKSEKDTQRSIRDLADSRKNESASERVERRLKQIERGLEVDRNNATHAASQVAQDLLRRSQSNRTSEDDSASRSRLLQMESGKRLVENELEATRRRLEQSEGGREALISQIGELRALINRSDKERGELQKQIQKQEAERKAQTEREAQDRLKLAASDRMERERTRQEGEIDELRAALKRSAGVVQLDDLRRDLEKSERQRQHLSDHIEVLTKDLEKKEQTNTRILHQLNELQRDFDESERDRDRVCHQLEDALLKVKEQTREAEKYTKNVQRMEEGKNECEKEKEELRSAAQDTIRQWKTKCRKQEKEIDRLRENIEQLNTKNEELVKDSIGSKTQANNAFQQAENLRKEMEDLIAKRVELDEQLRRRDNELEQTNEEKRLLMRNVQEMMQNSEKLEARLRESMDKTSVLNHKLEKNTEENDSLKSMLELSKQQTTELQRDIRETKLRNSELESHLSSEKNVRIEMEKLEDETRKQTNAMQMEISALHKQMQIERETHKKELQGLNSRIHSGEVERMEAVQRVGRKADEERVFLEGGFIGLT
nr:centrosomal protein of 128 kDa-like isoform X1 [Ciona intestinalis]|eukprot:XP_026694219.1 centrosomal protein of 128 kDa-like isoform X1 [Ciona intestinalis]